MGSGESVKAVQVVVGVIYNPARDQVLIAKRPDHLHQGGLWEFPGGKVHQDETPRQALHRELYEELTIRVVQAEPLFEVSYDYPDKSVLLDIWQVWAFDGDPHGNEGQETTWAPLAELAGYRFPAANVPILERLLPQ